jgi:D-tyrosyl-tRNA(Tyr) deacylase
VSQASVTVDGTTAGHIGRGLMVFLAVERGDTLSDVDYMAEKIVNLRVFPDGENRMNRSVLDTRGELLVISQFTLAGDCRKGRRPSFDRAEEPARAEELYEAFLAASRERGVSTGSGRFRASMDVSLTNNGPVTLLLSTKKEF